MQISLEPPYLIVKPGLDEEEFYRLADEEVGWVMTHPTVLLRSTWIPAKEHMPIPN